MTTGFPAKQICSLQPSKMRMAQAATFDLNALGFSDILAGVTLTSTSLSWSVAG
jgi:hypothetical protein